ncbi:MAG: FAD-binding protein [Oscillospiraceae bacterium]|nr:FAD-binding protein [Oscillospiraceae bacterium]
MISIDKQLCNGCGLCAKACMFQSITIIEKKAEIGDNCIFCSSCIEACPKKAISSSEHESSTDSNAGIYYGVWAILQIEERRANIKRVSYELVSEARKLADKLGENVTAVCLAKSIPDNLPEKLEELGCNSLQLVENDFLEEYDTEMYSSILSGLIVKNKPSIVLFPATENGRDLAPRISARLRVGLTADCTALDIGDDKKLIQIRPTYGGSIMASIITPGRMPQMASVRPNVFAVEEAPQKSKLEINRVQIDIDIERKRVESCGYIEKETVYKDVSDARVIIAGGYGVGADNFKLIHQIAIKTGAAVGASRKAVDEGWAPFEVQVGQTGKSVAPDLYIACGISGALQHTIGVKNSKKIIAINSDPAAPIFSICDVAILGDVKQVLTHLNDLLDTKKIEDLAL